MCIRDRGENSVKFGIVGAIEHPQVRYDSVNYSRQAWAGQPTQMISYVSCHDGLCLVDRLKASMPEATPEQLVRLDKLAQTVVFTSQGIPFIYAGEEVMRDKQGVDNSYKLSLIHICKHSNYFRILHYICGNKRDSFTNVII